MLVILLLVLLAVTSLVMLVRMVRSDGYGWRPPPASWVGEDKHGTWPR